MELWKTGELDVLLREAKAIQNQKRKQTRKGNAAPLNRRFSQLMLEGKVAAATRLVDASNRVGGVHMPSEAILQNLKEKHPPAEPVHANALISGPLPDPPDQVIFDNIDGLEIFKAAKATFGSGGPSLVDADIWKQLLCSNVHKSDSEALCTAVANVARCLCRTKYAGNDLKTLLASRLIPLDKDPGAPTAAVRPIGIGEVLRRIIGRSVIRFCEPEVRSACGTLQTSTGTSAGVESSIHAMKEIFDDDACEAVILVDADNAFNRLNRAVALENAKHTCPTLATYLSNTYSNPSKLFLSDGRHILSQEGTTQGATVHLPFTLSLPNHSSTH